MPLTSDLLNSNSDDPMPDEEATKYRAGAARLNYLAQDRPDLAVVSCVAAARMANPKIGDDMILKKVARYLKTYPDAKTEYHWQQAENMSLTLVTDSDWATCTATRKSRSGGAIFRGQHCISHWCKTQDRVARSSGGGRT